MPSAPDPPSSRLEVIVAVTGAIAALVLFWAWYTLIAPRTMIPAIVRGPLNPLIPPFTADRREIVALLRAGKFDQLDKMITSFQARAEADPVWEANALAAFYAFYINDPLLDGTLKRWVASAPDSYVAHLARAEFLFEQGWLAHGTQALNETPQSLLDRMHKLLDESATEAHAALAIDPRVSEAYAILLARQRYKGGGCASAAAEPLSRLPASFAIRAQAVICLEPRWGGNYPAMERFAAESQKYTGQNPLLSALSGFVDLDRGNTMWELKNYAGAVAAYGRAIRKGGDYSGFYRERGELMNLVRRNADALEDLRRADQLWPQSPETLEALAYALAVARQYNEALDRLNLAMEIGGNPADSQKLHDWLETQLAASSTDQQTGN